MNKSEQAARTDDERDHGGAVTTGLFKALDEFLDLPYLNVLLGLVRLGVAHDCGSLVVEPDADGSESCSRRVSWW